MSVMVTCFIDTCTDLQEHATRVRAMETLLVPHPDLVDSTTVPKKKVKMVNRYRPARAKPLLEAAPSPENIAAMQENLSSKTRNLKRRNFDLFGRECNG